MKRLMILAFALVVGSGAALAAPCESGRDCSLPQPVVTTPLQAAVPQRLDTQTRGPCENSLRDGRTQGVHAIRPL
jgi:hypothetical protein